AETGRGLRMPEEVVLGEEASEVLGESMLSRDEDFEPPEVPFQPKPTSVSILAIPDADANDFAGDSNHTTMPKAEPSPAAARLGAMARGRDEDVHAANTLILENGRSRNTPR